MLITGEILTHPMSDKKIQPPLSPESEQQVADFFRHLESEFKAVPPVVLEEGANRIVDFLKGDISWSEILNLTPDTLQRIAEFGYMQLQAGRLEDAERFFKVLTMLNWNNSYAHSMLGLVYQRQKRFGESLAQYSEAITQNPADGVSLVNRGMIYVQHGWWREASADLQRAQKIPADDKAPWLKAQKMLQVRVTQVKNTYNAKKSAKGKSSDGR